MVKVIALLILVLALTGCLSMFTESHSLVAVLSATNKPPQTCKLKLAKNARYIEFTGFGAKDESYQGLQISLLNRSKQPFLVKLPEAMWVSAPPNFRFNIFRQGTAPVPNDLHFRVSGLKSKTQCEISVDYSRVPNNAGVVKVYVLTSSPPL